MIQRKTVPYAKAPILLSGSSFSNIQKLLTTGYAAEELSKVIGKNRLSFCASWVNVGTPGQLTALTNQKGQGRLIVILNGSAYILSVSKNYHQDPVVFRLSSGTSEAVWVPEDFFQAFLFNSPNTIALTAATQKRTENIETLDTRDKRYKIELGAWGRKGTDALDSLVEI